MKTAVEWMVEKLFKPMDNPPIENVSDIIEQAKEMEKQQSDDYAIEFAEWVLNQPFAIIVDKELLEIFKNK